MTQTLMLHGTEGAEIVADMINDLFGPAITSVHERGGFISGFAGDAFTAIFPGAGVEAALNSALDIHNIMLRVGVQETQYGTFTLAAKQGIAAGEVNWGIVGLRDQKAYFFRGAAIYDCTQAEKHASGGKIVLSPSVKGLLPDNAVVTAIQDTEFSLLGDWDHSTSQLQKLDEPEPLDIRIADSFFSEAVLTDTNHGEFRNVVIVFISFEGDPDIMTLEGFITYNLHTVRRFGGHFSELSFGDKGGLVVAYFGAPVAYEDNRERAFKFLSSLRNFNTTLRWRAGVTHGPVYAGLTGAELRSQYTCLGNTANLAARLMTKAEWGQILVSGSAAQTLAFEFANAGITPYKGFSQPVQTYVLLEQRADEQPFSHLPLVGRETELQQMLDIAESMFQGQFVGAAILYGEPGVGKTRLTQEVEALLGERVLWLSARADQILRSPFNPFISMLKQYFQQSPDIAIDEDREHFHAVLGGLLTQLEQVEMAHRLRTELQRNWWILGGLLELPLPNSPYEELDEPVRHMMSLETVRNWLLALSCQKPLVIEIEDGQWLDDDSQELLAFLTEELVDYPIMIVLTSRYTDDGSPYPFDLSPGTPIHVFDVAPLQADSIRQLLTNVLNGPAADDLFAALLQKCQANPFFTEQTALYLHENGLVSEGPDGWSLTAASRDIPASVKAILVARIDRLEKQVQNVVKAAAVLGQEFSVSILSAILTAPDIESHVSRAEAERIWHNLHELRYMFRHGLLQEAAYEMQLRSRLHALHETAGHAIEHLYRDNLEPHYDDLAYHYERAGVPYKASYYLYKHGTIARRMSQYRDGKSLFQKALRLLDTFDEQGTDEDAVFLRIQCLIGLGFVTNWMGDLDAAVKHNEAALQLATDADQLVLQAEALAGLADAKKELGQYTEALEFCKQAVEIADPVDAADVKAYAYYMQALTQKGLGQLEDTLTSMRHALTLYQRSENRRQEASCQRNIGVTLGMSGEYDEALAHLREGIALCDETGAIGAASIGRFQEAHILIHQEHYSQAVALCDEAISIGDKISLGETQVTARQVKAEALMMLDDWEASQQVLTETTGYGYPRRAFMTHLFMGIVHLRAGDITATETDFQTALSQVNKHLDVHPNNLLMLHGRGLALCGMVLCSTADFTEQTAGEAFAKAIESPSPYSLIVDSLRRLGLMDIENQLQSVHHLLHESLSVE